MAGTSSFYTALDPKSLILSQFSNSDQPQMLQLTTTDCYFMERGPRYKDYAALRESRLRMKTMKNQPILEEEEFLILNKQVKFQGNFTTPPKRPKGSSSSSLSSVLTQSVPDFSSALRKENRKPPPATLSPVMEKSATPPLRSKSGNGGRFDGIMGRLGGSKSVNSEGKRNGGLMARKSYASMEDLRGLASDARNAINGENRGGGRIGKAVLGYRQF
ncbi:hypothetical protein ACH5RR_013846 [Cinchona calisaya]|uniref:Uncharacterized protein n=1 Tax=Cinchona calisaya TaxID=153742 RepID=A0ABD3A1B2_9GENT